MNTFANINIGNFANDQTGDTLRTAFQKINQNNANMAVFANVVSGNYSNSNVTSFLPTYTGNINASFYTGNGSQLTGITAGSTINFADNETVAGSGKTWTVAYVPNPANSMILVQNVPGFGGITLFQGVGLDYTLSSNNITTNNSITSGALRTWYRH